MSSITETYLPVYTKRVVRTAGRVPVTIDDYTTVTGQLIATGSANVSSSTGAFLGLFGVPQGASVIVVMSCGNATSQSVEVTAATRTAIVRAFADRILQELEEEEG